MEINSDLIIKDTDKSLNDLIKENAELKARLDSKIMATIKPTNVVAMNFFTGKKLAEGYYRIRGLIWMNNGAGICLYINNAIKPGSYIELDSSSTTLTADASLSPYASYANNSTIPRIGVYFNEGRGMIDCSFYYDGTGNIWYRSIARTVRSGRQRVAEYSGTLLGVGEITSLGISSESTYTFKDTTMVQLLKEDL